MATRGKGLPVLPREIIVEIAEKDLTAAFKMVMVKAISIDEFKNICNNYERKSFYENWLFLTTVRRTGHGEVWTEMAMLEGNKQHDRAWKVLDQDSCWRHQHWVNLAKYTLAMRGIYHDPEDRDRLDMQGCANDPDGPMAESRACEDHFCGNRNIRASSEDDIWGINDEMDALAVIVENWQSYFN